MAALNLHTGEVIGKDVVRNDSASSISFLEEIDAKTPAELEVHLVLDSGSSCVSKATKAWLADHPRFVVHHTPKHASWAEPGRAVPVDHQSPAAAAGRIRIPPRPPDEDHGVHR
jgi:2-succinyl-5-enolpyruvyl-6-hydroxy-3-cyclohexene-1-carboxylate synthase